MPRYKDRLQAPITPPLRPRPLPGWVHSKGSKSPLRRSPSLAGGSFRAAGTVGKEEAVAGDAGTMEGLLEKVRRGGRYVGAA